MTQLEAWDGVGPPTKRHWRAKDIIIDRLGALYRCTASGNPGLWQALSAGGGVASVTGNVVDDTDPSNPVVTAVETVTGAGVDNTDPRNPVVTGGGGSITSPLDIPGCALWLDFSDASTINGGSPSDNDPVASIADKSPSGFDAVQAVSDNQPTWHAAAQNGLGVGQFDPTSHAQYLGLSGDGLSICRAIDQFTVAMAGAIPSGSGGAGFTATFETPPGSRVNSGFFFGNGLDCSVDFAEDGGGAAVTSTQWTYPVTLMPYAFVAAVEPFGGMSGETSPGGGAGNTKTSEVGPFPDTASAAVYIGQSEGLGDGAVTLFEVVFYPRALSSGERRQLLEYLSAKWATL